MPAGNSSLWTAFLTPILTGLAFAALRWLLPSTAPTADVAPLTEDEKKRYARWEASALLPFFLFATLIGFACFFALRSLPSWIHRAGPETRFLLLPTPAYWAIPSLFLGIIGSAPPLHWLYSWLLGAERYARYTRFSNERHGYDGWKVIRWMAALVLLGAGVMVFLGVRTYTCFDEQGMTIARPLAVSPVHLPYDQIKTIEMRSGFIAPNGNAVARTHYAIQSANGAVWTTRDGLRDPDPELDPAILEFVARKSGKVIVNVP